MVKVVRSFPAPESLAEEAKKAAGRYDKPDVVERLKRDFHNKCYICEIKELQDPNVEHLLPHKNGKYPERKFDWENLFWSCGHCNGIKNSGKYDAGIIDCCKQDPEQYLTFHLRNDRVDISTEQEDEVYKRTATLITETFNLQNTGMRTYTSDERLRLLQKEMNILYKQLEKLHHSPNSKIIMRTICSLLRRESAFAAFKRCYVREHADEYPQLQKCLLDGEEM
ncbi:MAG: hypothetical protein NC318_00845 [Blautia sp.]|nr:hypothetical protein [Lachnoclostridium sp.]MCM1210133.1 hypothetical protein [Blautia sp.]